MFFNWFDFVNDYGIHYKEHGANVSRDNLNVKCPFCGNSDPSEHMGLSLSSTNWGCWRDPDHRGKKPARLVVALLGCSYAEAAKIVGEQSERIPGSIDDLSIKIESLFETKKKPQVEDLELEKCFTPLRLAKSQAWKNYLLRRGFEKPLAFSTLYDVRVCRTGKFSGRIVLPILKNEKLQGWTARSLKRVRLRYLTHPPGETIKTNLYNYDRAQTNCKVLVLCEGPFDALKVDYYGRKVGVRAVAAMNASLTPSQVSALTSLCSGRTKLVIAFDSGAMAQTLNVQNVTAHLNPEALYELPDNVKDPGDMTKRQVIETFERFT